jgi:hypothetical protein
MAAGGRAGEVIGGHKLVPQIGRWRAAVCGENRAAACLRLSSRSRESELGLAGVALAELDCTIQHEGRSGVEEDSP